MERPGWFKCTNPNCAAEKRFREDIRTGDIICTLCGRVAAEKVIDMSSEWRNFADSGEDKARAEKVEDDDDKLGTEISVKPGGEKSNNELSKLQHRIAMNENKVMSQAGSKIGEFAERLELKDDVKKKAKHIYKQFESAKGTRKVRGSNSDAIMVAVIYKACKELGVARTFRELARETGTREQEIKKMYGVLTKHLGTTSARPTPPHELVIRFCNHLGLPAFVMTTAEQIAKNVAPRLEGKSPSSIASASIFMAARHKCVPCSEKDIAKAASIAPSTVAHIYREMEPWTEELIPSGASV